MKSYAKEYCLLEQAYIHDGSKSVSQVLKEAEGKVGGPVKITGFARFALRALLRCSYPLRLYYRFPPASVPVFRA